MNPIPRPEIDAGKEKGAALATLVVLFYNQERFAEQAVRGALSQTYAPLEIILSDDRSRDGTFELIREAVAGYRGPHKIVLNRNESNLGLVGNVNRAMQLSEGEVILLSGGDDVSMPGRVARAMEILDRDTNCMCVSSGLIKFRGAELPGEREQPDELELVRSSWRNYLGDCTFHLNGAARAFRRMAFDCFGPIRAACPTEDSVILLRCLLLGDAISANDFQVFYRIHGDNLYSSDKKYQIDHDAIHEQYLRDLEVAQQRMLISESEKRKLAQALGRKRERGMLRNGLFNAPRRRLYFAKHILASGAYGWREKFRMLRAAICHTPDGGTAHAGMG